MLKNEIILIIIIPIAVKRNIIKENNAKYLKHESLENNAIAPKIKTATSEAIAVIWKPLKLYQCNLLKVSRYNLRSPIPLKSFANSF